MHIGRVYKDQSLLNVLHIHFEPNADPSKPPSTEMIEGNMAPKKPPDCRSCFCFFKDTFLSVSCLSACLLRRRAVN